MKTIVIDVDGVLSDIHAVVETIMHEKGYRGFNMNRVLTYDFNKSLSPDKAPFSLRKTDEGIFPYWLNAPRNEVFKQFYESRVFEEAVYSNDAIKILKLLCQEKSVNVVISTQSYTPEVAQIKKRRISEILKEYSYEYVDFIGDDKGVIDNADYVVEDCIANLDKHSEAGQTVIKILIDKWYNSEKYNTSANGFKDIVRSPDTASALRYILAQLTSWQHVAEQEQLM